MQGDLRKEGEGRGGERKGREGGRREGKGVDGDIEG